MVVVPIINAGRETVKKMRKVFEKDCNTPPARVYIRTEAGREQTKARKKEKHEKVCNTSQGDVYKRM